MNMYNKLTGMGVALVTPFKNDDSIDFEAFGRLIEYIIKNGVDYLVVCGTTAETPTLTEEEKDELARFAVQQNAGRLPVVLGIGGNNTKAVVEKIKTTDLSGIDAILSVTPYYNKPLQEGLYQHFASIAKVSPLPIILYNVPGRTGVNMTAETTLRLVKDFSNICAIKEASGNFVQIGEIIKNKPEDFLVISGDDGVAYPLITMGGVGVISVIGNAFPAEFSKMIHLALQGDYASARRIHYRFTELFELLFVEGNPAGVKSMLAIMGMIENKLRLPLVPTSAKTHEKIQSAIKQLN
jgi:4-hydroxy-tetrahydrodipicolinate synthase